MYKKNILKTSFLNSAWIIPYSEFEIQSRPLAIKRDWTETIDFYILIYQNTHYPPTRRSVN